MSNILLPVDKISIKQAMPPADNHDNTDGGFFESDLNDAIEKTMSGDASEKRDAFSDKSSGNDIANKKDESAEMEDNLPEEQMPLQYEISPGIGLHATPAAVVASVDGDLSGELIAFADTSGKSAAEYKSDPILPKVVPENDVDFSEVIASDDKNVEGGVEQVVVSDKDSAGSFKAKVTTTEAPKIPELNILEGKEAVEVAAKSDETVEALFTKLHDNVKDESVDHARPGIKKSEVAIGQEQSDFSMGTGEDGQSEFSNNNQGQKHFSMGVTAPDKASATSINNFTDTLQTVEPSVQSGGPQTEAVVGANVTAGGLETVKAVGSASAEVNAAVTRAGGWHEVEQNLFESVSRDIGRVQAEGNHKMMVKVHPPELGDLTLEVTLEESVLKVNFKAENVDVARIINAGKDELIGKFKEMGFETEQLNVDVETRDGDKGQNYNDNRENANSYDFVDEVEIAAYDESQPVDNIMTGGSGRISIKV